MAREDVDKVKAAYEERVRVLTEAAAQREQELLILSDVAARVHGEEDVQAILDIALDEILRRLGLKTAWIFMGDPAEKRLHLAASRGVSPRYLDEIRREGLGECLCPEVFWSGHHMQARNTTQCPRMPDIVEGLSRPVAHACIPMRFEHGNKGVLNVAAREGELFSEEQLRFLDTLGHQIGLAVERVRHDNELKAAQEQIVRNEKMAVLGTFASGLAHEVRNPLNSIALQLSVLERRIGRCEPETAAEMSELTAVIRDEVRRLDSLVGDFLLFSRTDRVQFRPANLALLVDDVLRLLAPEAEAAGVAMRHHRVTPVPEMAVDAEKVRQVVMNLARNAIEAMADGGELVIETAATEGAARLVVRDTGPGLPEGLDVFQLFVTTKPKGTGLGLSIVHEIVAQHGGTVTGAGVPGGGAAFTVTLPIGAARPAERKDASE